MLHALSGSWHEVYTGAALITDVTRSLITRTKVKFKEQYLIEKLSGILRQKSHSIKREPTAFKD